MAKTESIPAVFLTSPIGVDGAMEADGTVYHFCGTWCRDKFLQTCEDTHTLGTSDDHIDGTVCDYCEQAI